LGDYLGEGREGGNQESICSAHLQEQVDAVAYGKVPQGMEAEEAQPGPAGQRTELLARLPDDGSDGDEEEAQEDD